MTNYSNCEGNNEYNFELFEEPSNNVIKYEASAKNAISRSISTPVKAEKVVSQTRKMSKEEKRNRGIAVLLSCFMIGGFSSLKIAGLIETMKERDLVHNAVYEFDKNVINPHTHRTQDGQNYYYEYDEIADYITGEGKDFSTGLYYTYRSIGEEQTNRVLEHTGTDYTGVSDYANQAGFDSVDAWVENEEGKIILQSQASEQQAELDAMFSDVNTGESTLGDNYGGAK